eukprot:gene12774-14987_t
MFNNKVDPTKYAKTPIDPTKAMKVYLMVESPLIKSPTLCAHMAVLFDLKGGIYFPRVQRSDVMERSRIPVDTAEIIEVGVLPSTVQHDGSVYLLNKPGSFAHCIEDHYYDVFKLGHCEGTTTWGSKCNCHSYAKSLLQHLGLTWPTIVNAAIDHCQIGFNALSYINLNKDSSYIYEDRILNRYCPLKCIEALSIDDLELLFTYRSTKKEIQDILGNVTTLETCCLNIYFESMTRLRHLKTEGFDDGFSYDILLGCPLDTLILLGDSGDYDNGYPPFSESFVEYLAKQTSLTRLDMVCDGSDVMKALMDKPNLTDLSVRFSNVVPFIIPPSIKTLKLYNFAHKIHQDSFFKLLNPNNKTLQHLSISLDHYTNIDITPSVSVLTMALMTTSIPRITLTLVDIPDNSDFVQLLKSWVQARPQHHTYTQKIKETDGDIIDNTGPYQIKTPDPIITDGSDMDDYSFDDAEIRKAPICRYRWALSLDLISKRIFDYVSTYLFTDIKFLNICVLSIEFLCKWALSLDLLSKPMFDYVSTYLFTDINLSKTCIMDMNSLCEDRIPNRYCPLKYIETLDAYRLSYIACNGKLTTHFQAALANVKSLRISDLASIIIKPMTRLETLTTWAVSYEERSSLPNISHILAYFAKQSSLTSIDIDLAKAKHEMWTYKTLCRTKSKYGWALSLDLLSKRMFDYVSTYLFTDIDLNTRFCPSKKFYKDRILNRYCPLKCIEKLVTYRDLEDTFPATPTSQIEAMLCNVTSFDTWKLTNRFIAPMTRLETLIAREEDLEFSYDLLLDRPLTTFKMPLKRMTGAGIQNLNARLLRYLANQSSLTSLDIEVYSPGVLEALTDKPNLTDLTIQTSLWTTPNQQSFTIPSSIKTLQLYNNVHSLHQDSFIKLVNNNSNKTLQHLSINLYDFNDIDLSLMLNNTNTNTKIHIILHHKSEFNYIYASKTSTKSVSAFTRAIMSAKIPRITITMADRPDHPDFMQLLESWALARQQHHTYTQHIAVGEGEEPEIIDNTGPYQEYIDSSSDTSSSGDFGFHQTYSRGHYGYIGCEVDF